MGGSMTYETRKSPASRHRWLFLAAGVVACVTLGGCSETGPTQRPNAWAGARWFDDWFVVEAIDEQTFAIGEPLYDQLNVNYLIVGERRAILFDSGPGERYIKPVVRSLTDLPVTVIFSHAHFDHIGNHTRFESVALPDHPTLRARVVDGVFTPTFAQFGSLGRPSFRVSEWWGLDSHVDLGGRELRVINVPGHAPESIALYDAERHQLFSGDFIYAGDIFAFNPGADLGAYVASVEALLDSIDENTTIYGAHVAGPDVAPRLTVEALLRMQRGLRAIRRGEAGSGEIGWFLFIPLRRYAFEDGTVILTSLWD